MQAYMITLLLPRELTLEFAATIPMHRAHINRLFEQGRLTSYSVAADRSRVWATMVGVDENEIRAEVEKMPLYRFAEVSIQPLLFQNVAAARLPVISLN